MPEHWEQEARRFGGPILTEVLMEMRDNQRDLFAKLAEIQDSNDKLMSGFPAMDVDGHRRYHESVIEWRELRNKLVREALQKMIGTGALAAAGWLLLAIWQSFKLTVKQ